MDTNFFGPQIARIYEVRCRLRISHGYQAKRETAYERRKGKCPLFSRRDLLWTYRPAIDANVINQAGEEAACFKVLSSTNGYPGIRDCPHFHHNEVVVRWFHFFPNDMGLGQTSFT